MTIGRIPYMKSFILLIIMESGFFTNGFRGFPVFTVDVCPSNITEWEAASMRLNCTMKSNDFKNRYHCLATRDRSQLVEFCYPQIRSIYGKGQCVIFDSSFFLDNYTCLHFTDGCPDTYYFTDQLYKFPNCFRIEPVLKCFMSEELCLKKKRVTIENKEVSTSQTNTAQNQTTKIQEGIDLVPVLVPSIILPGIVFGIVFFYIGAVENKTMQRSSQNKMSAGKFGE
ncbi:uncharacterized protein LOC134245340 [Saccostrea cucullata]|uniref:uncharacterized protein LOC134245340 n=1 Tax=Saccostrea cuccullata TaxID=36930 RepID=UPI002ED42F65